MTTLTWASWQGADDCTDGPTSGARHLLAYLAESWPQGSSMGIYNCRSVVGGSTTSLHGEGRAVDWGMPMHRGRGTRVGRSIVDALGAHGRRLGIQAVIYDREIWSEKSPDGRYYGGQHPHYDHLHIELTWEAARRLTLATLREVAGDRRKSTDDGTPAGPEPDTVKGAIVEALGTLDLREDTSGANVTTAQHLLAARGNPPARTFSDGRADGISGSATRAALAAFQRRTSTGSGGGADLLVGPRTWAALLGTVRTIRFDRGAVRGSVVGTVQALLAARGHVPAATIGVDGRPDQVGGRRTVEALARFQRSTGTGASDGSADLIVGARTWAALARTD